MGTNKVVEMWYKKTHSGDTTWHGPNVDKKSEGYKLFHLLPNNTPVTLAARDLDAAVCTMLPKFFILMNGKEQQWYKTLIEKQGKIFSDEGYNFTIAYSRTNLIESDGTVDNDTRERPMQVIAPKQITVSEGAGVCVDKNHQIVFVKNNTVAIALVTKKPANNKVKYRLYKLNEEKFNKNDYTANTYKETKETAEVNINDVKLSGTILTQKGHVFKKLWSKFVELHVPAEKHTFFLCIFLTNVLFCGALCFLFSHSFFALDCFP